MQFRTLLPDIPYRSGLLTNFYFACVQRAHTMSVVFTGTDWTADSFDVRHSAIVQLSRCIQP